MAHIRMPGNIRIANRILGTNLQLCVSFFVSVVHAVENVGALLVQTLTARPVDCVSERLPTGASPYVKIAAMGDPCKAAQWTSA